MWLLKRPKYIEHLRLANAVQHLWENTAFFLELLQASDKPRAPYYQWIKSNQKFPHLDVLVQDYKSVLTDDIRDRFLNCLVWHPHGMKEREFSGMVKFLKSQPKLLNTILNYKISSVIEAWYQKNCNQNFLKEKIERNESQQAKAQCLSYLNPKNDRFLKEEQYDNTHQAISYIFR